MDAEKFSEGPCPVARALLRVGDAWSMMILRDADERVKRREAERLLVEERERHVQELEEANRQLREADRHKDEFVSVISHELRTPLTVVIGYADLLNRGVVGQLTPAQADVAGHIGRGARRLLALVMDLLE